MSARKADSSLARTHLLDDEWAAMAQAAGFSLSAAAAVLMNHSEYLRSDSKLVAEAKRLLESRGVGGQLNLGKRRLPARAPFFDAW